MYIKSYSPQLVRITMGLLFLWFGLNQIFAPETMLGYLPRWVHGLPFPAETFLLLNGLGESILGGALALGLFTRSIASLLSLKLFGIIISLGYNATAIRDIGLMMVTASIALTGPDEWCFYRRKRAPQYLKLSTR